MYQFSIRDIENLTGIKAHTLRVWEQRYNLLQPSRRDGNHRQYDNEDLKKLLAVSELYHRGWKISRIAALNTQALSAEIEAIQPANQDARFYLNQLIETAISLDKEGFVRTLQTVIERLGFEKAIVTVCYPLLQKIGLLWVSNRVVPAQEHFCSYIIQHKIIAETDKLPSPKENAPEILLFSPHGEYHELPLYFINYLLRKNGWTTLFLGTNTKMDLVKQFAASPQLTHLFLHIITNFTGLGLDDYLESVCKMFSEKKVVVSGAATYGVQRQFTNLLSLRSDAEIYSFVQRGKSYLGVT